MKQTVSTFPIIQARNLEGQNFNLPRDLQGKWSIVIVAFQRWQQTLVDAWLVHLNPLTKNYAELKVYEMPVISNLYALTRPFIDGGMARSIPDKAVREHTLTAYTNIQRVVKELGLANTETVAIFLLGAGGKVLWQGGGEYEAEQLSSLVQTLKEELEK